jgi:hypothetical protein
MLVWTSNHWNYNAWRTTSRRPRDLATGVVTAPTRYQPGSESYDHNAIHAQSEASTLGLERCGVMKGAAVYLSNVPYELCQKVADNLPQWFRQYRDVPSIKVVGEAPGLLSKVSSLPWNGNPPPVNCGGLTGATMAPIKRRVTRRVIGLLADGGFTCQLDNATSFMAAGVYIPGGEINYYDEAIARAQKEVTHV